jgi:hypothetical protein
MDQKETRERERERGIERWRERDEYQASNVSEKLWRFTQQ